MKEFNKIRNLKNRGQDYVKSALSDVGKINERKDITEKDKKNLSEHAMENAAKKLYDVLIEVQTTANEAYSNATRKLQKVQEVDTADMAQRQGAIISAMSDDELLNLYKNQHYDKATRSLVADIVSLRINSLPEPGTSSLGARFLELEKKLRPQLPDDELEAIESLDNAQTLITYSQKAEAVLSWEKTQFERKIQGGDLKGEEKVSKRMAEHDCNMIENSFAL